MFLGNGEVEGHLGMPLFNTMLMLSSDIRVFKLFADH
jgi:hypothetical protein